MSPEHREIRESLGAWAMGQLDPGESEAVERHLDSCPECRAEAASLKETGALLELVDPALADSFSEPLPQPSPELERRVMEGMRDEAPAAPARKARLGLRIALPALGVLAAAAINLKRRR